jgi:hypothetical protein
VFTSGLVFVLEERGNIEMDFPEDDFQHEAITHKIWAGISSV